MSGTNVLKWIWLQERLGYASRYASEAVRMGGANLIFGRSASELRMWSCFPEAVIEQLAEHDLSYAERVLKECEARGYQTVTPDDVEYPARLREIFSPPLVLYVSGRLPVIDEELCIAVVGTRSASQRGLAAAQELGMRLGKAGAIIVSGCAIGIDSAAQQGAIMANGRTIGVLGCGINTDYNARSRELRKLCELHGALVSEYPPSYPARQENFPQRNRIISGFSVGVAVIEAGERSGSAITARLALEQGRDLFAMPGIVGTANAVGVNRMIKDGAAPLTSPGDILSVYKWRFANKLSLDGADAELLSSGNSGRLSPERSGRFAPKPTEKAVKSPAQTAPRAPEPARQVEKRKCPEGVSDEAAKLFGVMSGSPETVDELAAKAGMTVSEAASGLLELELCGAAASQPGGRYSLLD